MQEYCNPEEAVDFNDTATLALIDSALGPDLVAVRQQFLADNDEFSCYQHLYEFLISVEVVSVPVLPLKLCVASFADMKDKEKLVPFMDTSTAWASPKKLGEGRKGANNGKQQNGGEAEMTEGEERSDDHETDKPQAPQDDERGQR